MSGFVVTCVILLCCYTFLSSSALELPPDGFWFNCGLDFCEFPSEYCRVIQGQRPSCQACTIDECYSLDTPSQCYSQCKELQNGGSDVVRANQAGKDGFLVGVKKEKQSTSSDRLALLLEENKRQRTILYVLVSLIMAMLIFQTVLVIKMCRDNRILYQRTNQKQDNLRPQIAGPQQMTHFAEDDNGVLSEITVEPAGANVDKKMMGRTNVVDNRPAEEVPLLPLSEKKQPAQAGEQCHPSEQSGNAECLFSPKLMDDGSAGFGRHMEESTDWPSDKAVLPVISQPIEDNKSTNLADCTLLDKHNMEQTLNASVPSTRRHSSGTEETTIKNVFETNTSEDKVSLPGDIEMQVQHRPRSATALNYVTPTVPPAELSVRSVSLSSERSGATSEISSPDSGHYGTGNSSLTGSVDLKENIMKDPTVNTQEVKL